MRCYPAFLSTIAIHVFAATAPALAAPDGTLGMALMTAVVESDGSLVRGSGAVSASRGGTGNYQVTFERSVVDCTITANTGYYAAVGVITTSFITVGHGSNANVATAAVRRDFSTAANSSFHMMVFCPK